MRRHTVVALAALVLGAAPLHAQDAITFTVSVAGADVYKAPSIASPVIGHVPGGRAFGVQRNLGSWVRIEWPGGAGGAGYLHVTWGTLSKVVEKTAAPAAPAPPDLLAPLPSPIGRPVASKPLAAPSSRVSPRPRTQLALPSHLFGVGGRLGAGPLGFSATGRAWTRQKLGAQLEVGAQRKARGLEPISSARVHTLEFAPSVLYSPLSAATDEIWVRPYLGGGLIASRSTRAGSGADIDGASAAIDSGLGYQVFGGAEMTWSALPTLAVSADLRREWLPVPFAGSRSQRFAFSASIHWYAK